MPWDPSEHNQVPQIVAGLGQNLQSAWQDYQKKKDESQFNVAAFEAIARMHPDIVPADEAAKFPSLSSGAQSALLTTYGSEALSRQKLADEKALRQQEIDALSGLRAAQIGNLNAEATARGARENPDPAMARALATGIPGISYVPGARQVVRDPTFNANSKLVASSEMRLNKQLAPFGLTHDDLGLIDTETPNVVRYVDAGGNPVTSEVAGMLGQNAFAVGDAAGKQFKIPLPKFQSFVNQKKVLDSLAPTQDSGQQDQSGQPAIDPADPNNPLNDNSSPEQMLRGKSQQAAPPAATEVNMQQAAAIKAKFKAGLLSRDQAKAQLQGIGLQ